MSDRSRSPRARQRHRRRSRSPISRSRHTHSSRQHNAAHPAAVLPFKAQPLRKNDLDTYRPLFELYLDIQKQKILDDLPEDEARGRWKSFLGKWNRAELAEGWYDPAMLRKAQESIATTEKRFEPSETKSATEARDDDEDDGEDEDDFGPALPSELQQSRGVGPSNKSGPAIPSLQDLELRREQDREDAELERADLRHERKADRQLQKSRLDEMVPRAESGTRERQLEKKREAADSNRSFAAAKSGGDGVPDVPDADLMGDEEGGLEGYKKRKVEMERKKNERELRKEEIWRARAAEREERLRRYREKEQDTMSGLVALAKARFG